MKFPVIKEIHLRYINLLYDHNRQPVPPIRWYILYEDGVIIPGINQLTRWDTSNETLSGVKDVVEIC